MGKPNLNPDNRLKITTEDPELAGRFNSVLGEVVEALEEDHLRYVFIGGIASNGLGRPRSTHDIDLFVPPEDAELTLRALAKRGFRVEKTDPSWLYKGFKDNILVDVIFRSKGDIYLDQEMYARSITAEFHGRKLKLVAPEDLLIIKAAAHSELCPNHWHDATALLSHASLDWTYLIRRARRAPRRVLSLLLYAQSIDIWVPNPVIHELFNGIFGDGYRNGDLAQGRPLELREAPRAGISAQAAYSPQASSQLPAASVAAAVAASAPSALAPNRAAAPAVRFIAPHASRPEAASGASCAEYSLSHLRECLAEDSRTNELDIQIEHASGRVLLRGEVTAHDRREAIGQIARECFPEAIIENQLRILDILEPSETEMLP